MRGSLTQVSRASASACGVQRAPPCCRTAETGEFLRSFTTVPGRRFSRFFLLSEPGERGVSSAPSRARPREPSSAPLREFASPAPRSSGYRPEAGSTHSFALRPPLSTLSSFPRRRGPPKSVRARDPVSRLPPHRSPPKPSWSLSRSPSPAPTRRSPSPNLPSLRSGRILCRSFPLLLPR